MTISEWPASSSLRKRAHQLGDVVEVQAGGRLVEQEQRALLRQRAGAGADALRRLGEEAGQLQALRLAARERRHRLAELHVLEADVDDRLQHAHHLAVVGNSCTASADREVEHVGDESSRMTSPGMRRSIFTSRISARKRRPSQSGQRR